ncbi:MAG: hypothetical protein B9S37_07620 [Verrucomicrobiia bacterium Tous-C3TDCM]|nr:MAG: hypothetical protein B9S37_07620 [Verrucomicrobiae bacterium Tous-C3TDCM]PAZ04801.1 MAG: hypothetical protein CAK88_10190 [Verrucomicrobiae bacterium AMD-G2]
MIISHRYKFIFIKTHKTAGSSMESALAPLCGPEDIITPMESNRLTDIPKNYHANNVIGKVYAQSKLFRKCINRHSNFLGKWYYEHMPAVRVRQLIGEEIWNSYKKICFERNPWAKVVSYYNWKKNGQSRKMPSFEEYVMKKSHRLPMDARLYFDGVNCIVDEVFDYEGFEITFHHLCEKLGIPFTQSMPREKTGVKQEKLGGYQDYYNDETREQITRLFSREIELMGYKF